MKSVLFRLVELAGQLVTSELWLIFTLAFLFTCFTMAGFTGKFVIWLQERSIGSQEA